MMSANAVKRLTGGRRESSLGKCFISLTKTILLSIFDQPNVSELNRHAVFLQHERTSRCLSQPSRGKMRRVEFLVVIDFYAIEEDRRTGFLGFCASGIEPWRSKIDVKRLPGEGGQTWPNFRLAGGRQAVIEPGVRRPVEPPVGFVNVCFV